MSNYTCKIYCIHDAITLSTPIFMTQRPTHLFLQRLKSLRKKAGLTQQDMADRIGLNQATYSAMERGRQSVLSDYLFQIAEILNIPVWQIFASPQEAGVLDNNEDQTFFEMWLRLTPVEREVLKAMTDQIMQKKALEEIRDTAFLSETISQVS